MFRRIWRDAAQFEAEDLPISSTTSNEAIQLYDVSLTQLVGWYDDPLESGLAFTLSRMMNADPDFILGKALSIGIDLIGTGTTIRSNRKLQSDLVDLKYLTEERKSKIQWREEKHVEAIDLFANGNMFGATQVWEDILLKHPTDMMALKFAHDTYFYLGKLENIRDSVARVYNEWDEKRPPLYQYVYGMYAFGLEENGSFSMAEKEAKKGLELMPNDPWAVHALAHVYEMTSQPLEGLKFVSSTVKQWDVCNYLACHNFWHWALFHIEQEDTDAAVEIFENEIKRRAVENGSILDIVDACSLLYRLDLLYPQMYTSNDKWIDVYQLCEPHITDHVLGFNDAHYVMACLALDQFDKVEDILSSYLSLENVVADNWVPVAKVILEAMVDYKREKYSNAVEKLLSVKNDIVKIGGSNAQRDVFEQLLIVSSLKAKNSKISSELIKNRMETKGNDVLVRFAAGKSD